MKNDVFKRSSARQPAGQAIPLANTPPRDIVGISGIVCETLLGQKGTALAGLGHSGKQKSGSTENNKKQQKIFRPCHASKTKTGQLTKKGELQKLTKNTLLRNGGWRNLAQYSLISFQFSFARNFQFALGD